MTSLSIRALQITDLHVVAQEGARINGTDSFESLRAVLQAARSLAAPPELVLATGDLSEDGSEASYRRLRAVLLDTGLPVHVLPGNHDSISGMTTSLLGGRIQMEPVVEVGAWRIVLLNSCVRGQSYGLLDDAQRAVLRSALAAEPRRPVLACLHHNPLRVCPSRGCHLQDDAVLLELVQASPAARAVISGHTHVELERRSGHVTIFTTPSTCAQLRHAQLGEPVDHEDFAASHVYDPSRHGFRMLTLLPDGELASTVHWVRAR